MELQTFTSFQFCILLVWSANGDAPFQGKFQGTRLNLRKTRVGIRARMGIVGIGHNMGQENLRRRSVERPEWKYQSQLGVLAGISLCKKYCIIFITIRVTLCPNVLLQDLKEESYFSILYYQAITVCKPVLIYCVCTFVVVSKSTV